METKLENLLELYWDKLIKFKAPLTNLLQPGVDKEIVEKKIAAVNINLPEEVYELYRWKNGTKIDESFTYDQTWIFPSGIFSSIEDSISSYNYYAGKDGYWKPSMFMLFESGGGEMDLIDCDSQSPTYKMIYKHYIGSVDYEVIITIYDSIEALFKTIIECFESDAYYYDKSGGLQFDYKKSIEISRKNNPRSQIWGLFNWITGS